MRKIGKCVCVVGAVAAVFAAATLFGGCGDKCAHEHVSEVVVVAPTCEGEGTVNFTCDGCGAVVRSEKRDALGHAYGVYRTDIAPTVEEAGRRVAVCAHDGSHKKYDAVPALSDVSVYESVTTAAECNAMGKTVYTSNVYGEFTVILPETDHDWSRVDTDGLCGKCGSKVASLGLTYTLSDDGRYYTVGDAGFSPDIETLMIPAEYRGLPVKEIANDGFAERRWIKTVYIPHSVERIREGAFSQAGGITKVYFDAENCADFNGRNWVFYPSVSGNTSSFEIVIGNRVKHIPARMFYPLATEPANPARLNKLTFEDGSSLRSIGEYAFCRTDIADCILPDSVRTIGDNAFYGTGITELRLGARTRSLGNGAFGACESLESVDFGKSLHSIGDDCFNYCKAVAVADMSATAIETIGADAFKNCAKLETAVFPATLAVLGRSAFAGCKALGSAALSEGVVEIGESAFSGCALTDINVPKTVKRIGSGAFDGCTDVARILFDAENCEDLPSGNRVFCRSGGGVTVTIGGHVAHIPARLFYGSAQEENNIAIGELELSASVEEIGDYAFFGISIGKIVYGGSAADIKNIAVGKGNGAVERFVSGE